MNKKELKKNILKTKVTIISALSILAKTSKVKADIIDNLVIDGETEYTQQLVNDLKSMPFGLQQYLLDNNNYIYLLGDDELADYYYEVYNGCGWDTPITGFYQYIDSANRVFAEACKQGNYYYDYPESSKGLSEYEFNYRIARDTVFHELAHSIDGEDLFYSMSDYFLQIYDEEKDSFIFTEFFNVENLSVYSNIRNSMEYFATTFSAYINNPDDLLTFCPKTYSYMDSLVKEICLCYEDDYSYEIYPDDESSFMMGICYS